MALYRKYRPATFAEVVGQEHVTEPLSVALDSGRINHAYLFSGPRGCGKTSSARILARSLNCVEGPTSTPCGVCDSCVALAPGGSGSLDVTELDAASHRGVDDMRDLRDRAFYAPADSRYRVFIIDEAHMITNEGFNTLLKIVEEPPEHLIFIFATTEPEKLLATIRSRTHNYPFRLLTPPAMRGLLERIISEEGVQVEDSVYPLVVRAGGGSPRDSLSIMDQLLAGAGPEGVTYKRAVGLLGVTDSTLLDRAADALAEHDQAALFSVVDDVINAGYDPRRFAMDLLDRFRDLLVVQAVPDAFDAGLVDAPADQQEALLEQADRLGQATLTRCAAVVNDGLSQMRGATAPRLLLEILVARMALPAAGLTIEALAQRVEALEQGQTIRTGGVGMGAGAGGKLPAGPSASAGAGQQADAAGVSSGKRYERPSKRKAAEASAAAAPESGAAQEQPQASQPQASPQVSQPEPQRKSTAEASQPQTPQSPASGEVLQHAVSSGSNETAPDAAKPEASATNSAKSEASEPGTAESGTATPESAGAPPASGAGATQPEEPSGAGAEPNVQSEGAAEAAQPSVAPAEPADDEDPMISQAREAREIMDRHRAANAAGDSQATATGAQESAGAQTTASGAQATGDTQTAADGAQTTASGAQPTGDTQPAADGAQSTASGAQTGDAQRSAGSASDAQNQNGSDTATSDSTGTPEVLQHAVSSGSNETAPGAAKPDAVEPAQAGQESSESPAEQWAKILDVVKQNNLSAWIAGRDARAADEQPKPGEFIVEHNTGALAKFVNSDRNAPTYRQAAEQVLGQPVDVIATVGGTNPGKADAGSAPQQNTEPAPQQPNEHTGQNNDQQPQKQQSQEQQAQEQQTQGQQTLGQQGNGPQTQGQQTQEPQAQDHQGQQNQQDPYESPVPAEGNLDSQSLRTSATSALERARQMAESARTAQPKPQPQNQQEEKPKSGWRARLAGYQASRDYKYDNGFNGVPLPDEPPADPWDNSPNGQTAPNQQPAPNQQYNQQPGQNQTNQPGQHNQYNPNGPGQQPGQNNPNNQNQQPPSPADRAAEIKRQQDEIMEDLASGKTGEQETRASLDIAGELIEKYLGGERLR